MCFHSFARHGVPYYLSAPQPSPASVGCGAMLPLARCEQCYSVGGGVRVLVKASGHSWGNDF